MSCKTVWIRSCDFGDAVKETEWRGVVMRDAERSSSVMRDAEW
jgi:hypothetical protein